MESRPVILHYKYDEVVGAAVIEPDGSVSIKLVDPRVCYYFKSEKENSIQGFTLIHNPGIPETPKEVIMNPEDEIGNTRIYDEAIDLLSSRIDDLEETLTELRKEELRYRDRIDRCRIMWNEKDDEQSRLISAKETLMRNNPARL